MEREEGMGFIGFGDGFGDCVFEGRGEETKRRRGEVKRVVFTSLFYLFKNFEDFLNSSLYKYTEHVSF